MKTCRVCKIEKPFNDFNKSTRNKDGLNNMCKECGKEYAKKYRKENYERVIQKEREYDQKNKENRLKYREENKEEKKRYAKKYREENKDKVNLSIRNSKKKRYRNDPIFRLKESIKNNIRKSIKRKGYSKNNKTNEILGCSYEEFKTYLESQFEDWMNWDNYGNPKDGMLEPNKTWDIDHIIPISSAINENEVVKLNHFTNLQPLCSYINRNIKKDKF